MTRALNCLFVLGIVGSVTACGQVGSMETCSSTCDPSATCDETSGAPVCACEAGFEGDGRTDGTGCTDVDECAGGLDDCADEGICSNDPGGFACSCPDGSDGDGVDPAAGGTGCTVVTRLTGARTAADPAHWTDGTFAVSCQAYRNPVPPYLYDGSTGDGYYRIQPPGLGAFAAYCDMTTDGGGWTLVARIANGWGDSRTAPFFTQSLVQSDAGFADNVGNATPIGPTQDGIYDVTAWPDPAAIRYLVRDTATSTIYNEVAFSDATSIAHLRRYTEERDARTGAATGVPTAFGTAQTFYYASDAEQSWYYWGGIMGRSRDATPGTWQFGLSVNLPDGIDGYDGIHDDQLRAYLNLGVGVYGTPGTGYDISAYWPGACETACDEWETTVPGQAVIEVWHR